MALIQVVKYDGGPDVFAWKYPDDELGTWTQLVVNEAQEAVLFKNGVSYDLFTGGRYTLITANIPILNEVVNLPFGGDSPFKAEVWYINKTYNLDVKWGTPTPIQIQDPKYGIFAPVLANGAFGLRIEDSRKFLNKLVGTLRVFDKRSMVDYFRGLYVTKVKDAISSYLTDHQVSIVQINAYIDELSTHMREQIRPIMAEYGIELVNFYINEISVPDDDPSVETLRKALSKRAEMDIVGYTYQQDRSFDTLEGAAINPGSIAAPIMGAGMGLGMGYHFGNAFGEMAREVRLTNKNENEVALKKCPKCGKDIPAEHRFCGGCGCDTQGTKQEQVNVCSACSAPLSKDDKFCPECGRTLNLCQYCGADIPNGLQSCPHCNKPIPTLCPQCKNLVEKGDKFCRSCGTTLVKVCPGCGASTAQGARFCAKCGTAL